MPHVTSNIPLEKLGEIFTGPMYQVLFSLIVISDVYRSFIPNKTTYNKNSVDFKAFWELWNSLCKTVPGKFNRSSRHSKYDCIQGWSSFDRSPTWQIVVIFNTFIQLAEVYFLSISLISSDLQRHLLIFLVNLLNGITPAICGQCC